LAQVSNDEDPKKLQPLTVPKIIEQLERALIDIKYNDSSEDELVFNKIENVPINSKKHERPQFMSIPIDFAPKKAWASLEPQCLHRTQILSIPYIQHCSSLE